MTESRAPQETGPGATETRAPQVRIGPLSGRRLRVTAGGRFAAAYTLGAWRPYVYPLLTPSQRRSQGMALRPLKAWPPSKTSISQRSSRPATS